MSKIIQQPGELPPLWKRLLWLFALWLAGVGTVLLLAELVRLSMQSAGLKTH